MKLIVNADDFGFTSGVNRAVVDCFSTGSLSSATLAVNMPASEEAAGLARAHRGLGVGLHFNLTSGEPVAPKERVPSLIGRDGRFLARAGLIARVAFQGVIRRELERELHAQAERFRSFGIDMTHVDSHQHAHLLPVVFDVVACYCMSRNLPMRIPWVWPGPGRHRTMSRGIRQYVLGRAVRSHLGRWGDRIRCNRAFASAFDVVSSPGEISEQVFRQILLGVRQHPLEIMVHPAWRDEELDGLTSIGGYSHCERTVLTRFSVRAMAQTLGWELVSWADAF